MTIHARRGSIAVVLAALSSWSAVSLAEEPPTASTPTEPSDEELHAIEEALAADAHASSNAAETIHVAESTAHDHSTALAFDAGLILDVAGAWFSGEPMQVGAHDPDHTGFTFRQLEMTFGASVDPYLRFDANIVFTLFGVEIEEAYATALALPGGLQLRAGQFLMPFGRLNPAHPHMWAFLDQPLANGKLLGSEGSRGVGGELSWLTPLPWFVELTGAVSEASGQKSFYGGDDLHVEGVEDLLYTTRLEQFFPFGESFSLLWGVSAQFGPNPTGAGNRTEIYGSDLYLRYRPVGSATRMAVSLQLEGMFRTRQVPGAVLQDWGGYGQLVWDITPRWQTAARYELVSGLDGDDLNPEWVDYRQRISVQGTFAPSHFSRVRLQLAYDDPQWIETPVYAAMLGLEVLVGAHGSHEF